MVALSSAKFRAPSKAIRRGEGKRIERQEDGRTEVFNLANDQSHPIHLFHDPSATSPDEGL